MIFLYLWDSSLGLMGGKVKGEGKNIIVDIDLSKFGICAEIIYKCPKIHLLPQRKTKLYDIYMMILR